jgi:hypothetical protein
MADTDIHSCGYYCDRHACIVVQRNELRDKLLAKEWVGLTDEEIEQAAQGGDTNFWDFCRIIEAKLKEKNNG